jgi:hypothetical protein
VWVWFDVLFIDTYLIDIECMDFYVGSGWWVKTTEIVEGKRSLRVRLLRSVSGGCGLTSTYIKSEVFYPWNQNNKTDSC